MKLHEIRAVTKLLESWIAKEYTAVDISRECICRIGKLETHYRNKIQLKRAKTLKRLNVPVSLWLGENSTLSVWKDENALSDLISAAFVQENGYLLRRYFQNLEVCNKWICSPIVEREYYEGIDRRRNRADIRVNINRSGVSEAILLEHKIFHTLSVLQLRQYETFGRGCHKIIVLSSKRNDFKKYNEYLNKEAEEPSKWKFSTHIDLLKASIGVQKELENPMIGFLIAWLADVCVRFKGEIDQFTASKGSDLIVELAKE